MSKLNRYTGQQEFASYERGGSYNVREESKTADSLSRQYQEFEQRQNQYIRSIGAAEKSQTNALEAQIADTERIGQNVERIAAMTKWFSDTTAKVGLEVLDMQERQGYESMTRLLDNPLDPAVQADYNVRREAQMAAAEEVDKFSVEAEKSGVDISALETLNNATGRRAIGMREAYALHKGNSLKQVHQQILLNDNQTQLIDHNGETFTPVEVNNDPVRAQIVFEHAVQQAVTSDQGMQGMSEGTQEIAMAPIREYRKQYMQSVRTNHVRDLKDASLVEARNELAVSLSKEVPDLMGFQRAVLMAQRRGGLSPTKARKQMLELAYIIALNQNNPELVNQIGSTINANTGQRLDVAYAADFQEVAAKVNQMQDQLNQKEEEHINANGRGDARELHEALMSEISGNGLTTEEFDQAKAGWQARNPQLPFPQYLQKIGDNLTLQERDRQDQEKEILTGLVDGSMTTEELKNGRYSPELVLRYEARASKNTEQTAVIRAKNLKKGHDAVRDKILNMAGLAVADSKNPSVTLAIAAAQSEVTRQATILLTDGELELPPGKELNEYAIDTAAMAVVKMIKEGSGSFGSNGLMGADFAFPSFDRGELSQLKVEQAQERLKRIQDTVLGGGVAAVQKNTNDIYTEAEANATDTEAVKVKAQRIANTLTNSGKPTTGEQVLEMMRDKYGVKSDKPVYTDKYAENAMGSGLMKYLNSGTSSGHNLVAAQANLLPVHIRPGYQHYRDVINSANYFKFPPHLLPLVAATYGLESGWGEYPSGNNNVFNIKGRGTVVEGSEYRDYRSVQESIGDFVELMKDPRYKKVMSAKTPMEAAIEMKNAGYAEDPNYIDKMRAVFQTMGLDPDTPYDNKPRTKSQWSNPALMSPVAQFRVIEHLSGDWSHSSYRADHGGSNYHEHLTFPTPDEARAAAEKLNAAGIRTTELKDVNPVGGHSQNSYHYTGQAFDVPADQVPVGEEQMLSLRVRQILGIK